MTSKGLTVQWWFQLVGTGYICICGSRCQFPFHLLSHLFIQAYNWAQELFHWGEISSYLLAYMYDSYLTAREIGELKCQYRVIGENNNRPEKFNLCFWKFSIGTFGLNCSMYHSWRPEKGISLMKNLFENNAQHWKQLTERQFNRFPKKFASMGCACFPA